MGGHREEPQELSRALDELALGPGQREQLARYAAEVFSHNKKVNLTSAAGPAEIVRRHIADGLACVGPLRELLGAAPRLCDMGSGAGFIGMAVKVAWPEAEVTLLETRTKRFEFLNLAAARSGLKGLRVLKRDDGRRFDAVIERALAPLEEALELGLPLAAEGGVLLAYQASPPDPADPRLNAALARLSLRLLKSFPYRLPGEERQRFLAAFQKGKGEN